MLVLGHRLRAAIFLKKIPQIVELMFDGLIIPVPLTTLVAA